MFDLNIDHLENEKLTENNPLPSRIITGRLTTDEHSGNSNSNSSHVMDDTREDIVRPSPESITRQFFPAAGENCGFGSWCFRAIDHREWLKLSSCKAEEVKSDDSKQEIKKSRRGPRSKSSQYRGVTFYRRTGRWESHIWDCGKQVYLGGFDSAHSAARAYDQAAIKFRGDNADINFTLRDYEKELNQMRDLSKEEFVQILRRHINGGSLRGSSRYRGVTPHEFVHKSYGMGDDKGIIKQPMTKFERHSYNEENSRKLDLSLTISLPEDLKSCFDGYPNATTTHPNQVKSQDKTLEEKMKVEKARRRRLRNGGWEMEDVRAMQVFPTAASSGFSSSSSSNFSLL